MSSTCCVLPRVCRTRINRSFKSNVFELDEIAPFVPWRQTRKHETKLNICHSENSVGCLTSVRSPCGEQAVPCKQHCPCLPITLTLCPLTRQSNTCRESLQGEDAGLESHPRRETPHGPLGLFLPLHLGGLLKCWHNLYSK